MNGSELLRAVERGDPEAVRALLAGGADVNERCRSGQTALMSAAAHGHLEAVRLLLRAGANVNARRDDGMTALLHAAFFGHADVVRVLLDEGADLRARDWIGMTPIDWARSQGAMEVVGLLAAAARQAAPTASVSRGVRAENQNGAGQVLSLPVPETSPGVGLETRDDVLDLTRAREPQTHAASTRPSTAVAPPPPTAGQDARNGKGAGRTSVGTAAGPVARSARQPNARAGEQQGRRAGTGAAVRARPDSKSFRHDASPTLYEGLHGATERPAAEPLEERGAATYGSVGREYLKSAPTDSYMYVGFFLATVFGSALILLFLFLSL